jgi:NAD(P)-dependent dehydrogenase (short-subunit alcohol dehydrogenase family)
MNKDWLGLTGTACVVTGAGSGIGRTIAASLAQAGAKVAILDLDAGKAEESAALIRQEGGEVLAVRADIANPSSVEAAAETAASAYGPCKLLVNNAALIRNGPLAELSLADWNAVLGVNLTGFFVCSQVFGRRMMADGGGSIVHVASLSGTYPQPTSGAYSVSKAGVLMLSKNLALEWGEKGIRSNVVSPAMVLTPMSEVIYKDPVVKAKREAVVPVGRIGLPQDIADAVCFLTSDRASYVSGQEILVDGGWSAALLATVPRPGFDQPKKT